MRAMFLKRKQDFRAQCIKYLRYVLNDHFILFLMVFLGFVAVQYSQLLRHFPQEHLPIWIALFLLSIVLVLMGRIATYFEKPDNLFLLAKEEELRDYIKDQIKKSFLLWGFVQTFLLSLLVPIFVALGWSIWGFILYALLLLGVKGVVFQQKSQKFFSQEGLDWRSIIAYEERRKQRILQFYALFTNVKGISSSVKRRAYLDILVRYLPKRQNRAWDHLFLRSYLRNGDFFALTLRLLLLSVLVIVSLPQSMITAVFVSLFQYLLLFQLLGIYEAYDYQYLTNLFPLEEADKLGGARRIITAVGTITFLLELVVALLFFNEKIMILIIVGIYALLYAFYLPYKLNRLVD